jgi:hypothetical protein
MLEEVGVERTLGQRQVGLHVVVELHQLDLVALLFEDRHDAGLQLVGVGAGGAADHQVLLGGVLRMGLQREASERQRGQGQGENGTAQENGLHEIEKAS